MTTYNIKNIYLKLTILYILICAAHRMFLTANNETLNIFIYINFLTIYRLAHDYLNKAFKYKNNIYPCDKYDIMRLLLNVMTILILFGVTNAFVITIILPLIPAESTFKIFILLTIIVIIQLRIGTIILKQYHQNININNDINNDH